MKKHYLLLLASVCVLLAQPSWAQQAVVGDRLDIANEAALSGTVGHPDYVSQLAKWRIDSLGAADFRYLFTDELHAKSFIADLEQALAGGQIISKSVAALASNFTVPAAGVAATITVRDLPSAENMAVFEAGDTIRLRSFSRASGSLTIADAYGVVTAYADQAGGVQNWTFTRNSGADAGGMTAGTVIQADAIVLDYGVSGNGFHEVNAIDGIYGLNSPYSQVVTWATSPIAANLTVRSRIGNLRGITGVAGEFGALFGTYAASNGQYIRASNQGVELHGVNLQMWDGATNVIKLDRTVPSLAIGTPIPSGYLTGGDGFWVGKDASVYKLRIGNPTGNRLTWDGTTLSVVGDGSGVTNINGGNIQTDTITATQIAANAITASEINAGAITAAKIAADTITSNEIAANAITASELNAGSVTAAKISVTTLSAITANLGTVTAGVIDGVTIRAGSSDEVTLDSSGITLASGVGTGNRLKFNDGSYIYSDADWMTISADTRIALFGGLSSMALYVGSNDLFPQNTNAFDLGTSSLRFRDLYLTEAVHISSFDTTVSADDPVVFSGTNGRIYRKTNGISTTCANPTSITIESGIVVGCS